MIPHKCPNCNGYKTVSKPPWVAGDVALHGRSILHGKTPTCTTNGGFVSNVADVSEVGAVVSKVLIFLGLLMASISIIAAFVFQAPEKQTESKPNSQEAKASDYYVWPTVAYPISELPLTPIKVKGSSQCTARDHS